MNHLPRIQNRKQLRAPAAWDCRGFLSPVLPARSDGFIWRFIGDGGSMVFLSVSYIYLLYFLQWCWVGEGGGGGFGKRKLDCFVLFCVRIDALLVSSRLCGSLGLESFKMHSEVESSIGLFFYFFFSIRGCFGFKRILK